MPDSDATRESVLAAYYYVLGEWTKVAKKANDWIDWCVHDAALCDSEEKPAD